MRPGQCIGRYFYAHDVARSETADRLGIDNSPPSDLVWSNAVRLSVVLDAVWEFAGPLQVISWYRCEELNRKVGGQRNSLHLFGCAADIRPAVKDVRLAEIMAFLAESPLLAYEEAILESGKWSKWIHIGVPKDPQAIASLDLLSLTKGQKAKRWAPSDDTEIV